MAWEEAYGGWWVDQARGACTTSDGGFILAGYNSSDGPSQDLYLVKTDGSGNLVWEETYGGASTEYGYSVVQTSDGGYAATGYTQSFGAGGKDVYLVRTDADGALLWDEAYGSSSDDEGRCLIQTSDGGFTVAGARQASGGGWNACLMKISADGVLQWERVYGGSEIEYANSVVQTSDGGYALLGRTYSFGAGSEDFYLVRTDSIGMMMWYETFGGPDAEEGNSLEQTMDGGFILGGSTSSFGAGGYDMYLVKTDPDGNEEWSTTFGTPGSDGCNDVLQTWDGGYALTGYRIWGGTNAVLIRTDDSGDTVWTSVYGGSGSENAFSIMQMPDGGYAVAGITNSMGAGDYDCWLLRTEPPMGIEGDPAPSGPVLQGITPNPARRAVSVEFRIPAASPVSLSVYDLSGRLVGDVVQAGVRPAGAGAVIWELRGTLSPGCYLAVLQSGGWSAKGRFVLLGD